MDVTIELLHASRVGITLKFLKDYLETYATEMPQVKQMTARVNQILVKWKNYANNCLFDENVSHHREFAKNRLKKAAAKMPPKGKPRAQSL